MAKIQKQCKICGKKFIPCADCENDNTMFRWKRVACSPECAKEYFRRIEESRQPMVQNVKADVEVKPELISIDNNSNVNDTENVDAKIIPKKTRKRNNVENIESEQID